MVSSRILYLTDTIKCLFIKRYKIHRKNKNFFTLKDGANSPELKYQPSFRSACSAFLFLLPQLLLIPVEGAVSLGVHQRAVVAINLRPIPLGPGRLSGS